MSYLPIIGVSDANGQNNRLDFPLGMSSDLVTKVEPPAETGVRTWDKKMSADKLGGSPANQDLGTPEDVCAIAISLLAGICSVE
jgi:hypothetical protein